MKKVFKVLGIIILVVVILFAGLIVYFKVLKARDYSLQEKRMEALRERAADKFDEQRYAAFDLNDPIRFNDIQVVATHNSYKKYPSALATWTVELYERGGSEELKYGHATLWEQFNRGVRSIELDIRQYKDRLEINHVPLVDNRTTCPDFSLALEEIKLWSDKHPNHVPITVIIELKSDWRELAPLSQSVDLTLLDRMDEAVRAVIPEEQLLTPDDVIKEGKTLEQSIVEDGWPMLSDVRGKIMIILHEHPILTSYHEAHENLEGCAMFTCMGQMGEGAPILLMNDPMTDPITEAVQKNYLVRTRTDSGLVTNKAREAAAMESGAQLLSTDFPPGEPQEATQYIFTFDGKTIRRSPVLP